MDYVFTPCVLLFNLEVWFNVDSSSLMSILSSLHVFAACEQGKSVAFYFTDEHVRLSKFTLWTIAYVRDDETLHVARSTLVNGTGTFLRGEFNCIFSGVFFTNLGVFHLLAAANLNKLCCYGTRPIEHQNICGSWRGLLDILKALFITYASWVPPFP